MTDYCDIPTSPVDDAIRELPSRDNNLEHHGELSNTLKLPFNSLTSGAKQLLHSVHFWSKPNEINSNKNEMNPSIKIEEATPSSKIQPLKEIFKKDEEVKEENSNNLSENQLNLLEKDIQKDDLKQTQENNLNSIQFDLLKTNNNNNDDTNKEIRKTKSSDALSNKPRLNNSIINPNHRNSTFGTNISNNTNLTGFQPFEIPKETMEFVKSRSKNKAQRDFDKMFLSQVLMYNGKDALSIKLKNEQINNNNNNNNNNNQTTNQNNNSNNNTNKATTQEKPSAIWTFSISKDGEYLACGGQDGSIRIWGLRLLNKEYQLEYENSIIEKDPNFIENFPIFTTAPIIIFKGHESDILDLAWSKTGFLLSCSTDKTARLWHVKRPECLCVYQHMDFVTSVAFHPKNDRYFLSGSLDCRVRLWNIPDKKVSSWTELPNGNLVTAVGFSYDGKLAIAGSYHGLCMFFKTEGLKLHSQFVVKSGAKTRAVVARKITGIEAIPDPTIPGGKVMITSNDSRIRIYNLNDLTLDQKFKGPENNSNQIKATFSDDLKYVVCGSENYQTYIFNLNQHQNLNFLSSQQSQQNNNNNNNNNELKKKSIFKKKSTEIGYEIIEGNNNIVTVASLIPTITKKLLLKNDDPLYNSKLINNNNELIETQEQIIYNGHILIIGDGLGNLKVLRKNILNQPYTPSIRSLLFEDTLSIHKLSRISKEFTKSMRRERKGSDASTRTDRSFKLNNLFSIDKQQQQQQNDNNNNNNNNNELPVILKCSECQSNQIQTYYIQPKLKNSNNNIKEEDKVKEEDKEQLNNNDNNKSTLPFISSTSSLPLKLNNNFTNELSNNNINEWIVCLNCKKILFGL